MRGHKHTNFHPYKCTNLAMTQINGNFYFVLPFYSYHTTLHFNFKYTDKENVH